MEYYDIKLNEWKMVSPMPWKGVTVKCAAVGSGLRLGWFQGVESTETSLNIILKQTNGSPTPKSELFSNKLFNLCC